MLIIPILFTNFFSTFHTFELDGCARRLLLNQYSVKINFTRRQYSTKQFDLGTNFSQYTCTHTWESTENLNSLYINLKEAEPRDFPPQVFFMNQFPLSNSIAQFKIFSKIHGDICSSRCITGVVDTGGKREKSLIRKVFNILFGHLWIVE